MKNILNLAGEVPEWVLHSITNISSIINIVDNSNKYQ
jgi:hypothetical protein